MKYNPKNKMLEFESDAEVSGFHDQLTGMMRMAMSTVGTPQTSDEEALRLTNEFFQRFAALTDALNSFREHLPQNPGG